LLLLGPSQVEQTNHRRLAFACDFAVRIAQTSQIGDAYLRKKCVTVYPQSNWRFLLFLLFCPASAWQYANVHRRRCRAKARRDVQPYSTHSN